MQYMQQKCFAFFAALVLCASLAACSSEGESNEISIFNTTETRSTYTSEELQFTTPAEGDTVAIFTTDLGKFSVVLYDDIAPQACDNFITLAEEGFYDGTALYRIISGFCVQGGLDADGQSSTAWGGSTFPMETSDSLHHYAGALCTALNDDDAASSAFYIVQAMPSDVSSDMLDALETAGYREEVIDAYDAVGGVPYLDYTDTVFGQVYDGMDVIDEIAALETDEDDAPLEAVYITSVQITTY